MTINAPEIGSPFQEKHQQKKISDFFLGKLSSGKKKNKWEWERIEEEKRVGLHA